MIGWCQSCTLWWVKKCGSFMFKFSLFLKIIMKPKLFWNDETPRTNWGENVQRNGNNIFPIDLIAQEHEKLNLMLTILKSLVFKEKRNNAFSAFVGFAD